LNTIALSGKRYLVIIHEVDQWRDTKEIEQRNKNHISTFAKRFPEYPDVFGGLVAEATVRGGNNGLAHGPRKGGHPPHWAIAGKVDSFVGAQKHCPFSRAFLVG
jgi:hypothetical protein